MGMGVVRILTLVFVPRARNTSGWGSSRILGGGGKLPVTIYVSLIVGTKFKGQMTITPLG